MSKLHDMKAIFAQDLRGRCGIVPDMALLDWVMRALGPLMLAPKSAQISDQDDTSLHKAVASFMSRHHLPTALVQPMVLAIKDSYPSPQRYRAVITYLIAQNFALPSRSAGH